MSYLTIFKQLSETRKRPYQSIFIGKRVMKSQEGTADCDPIAMAVSGVAILPPIDMLANKNLTHKC